MRVIGLDPGLRRTGWGVIDSEGTRLRHVANGVVTSDGDLDLARRLVQLDAGLLEVLLAYRPDEAAVEASLVNKNAGSTLKLGVARGVVLLTPAKHGLPVAEYLPMIVKKAVVGTGHASKEQVQTMVGHLLPGCAIANPDAADALAVAICHSHYAATGRRWSAAGEEPLPAAQGGRR
ncbi:MAG: crossover junction endodeoxyribonuclease RuvC [Rhodospirillales bacterium]|nr:crossover junction endodeoxyribonuclease RuvC [Rhodospirillales bacterium]MDH3793184.1 crossover junction endodeoxyribonuclease RuvC [Rhodospirillales bacterium]MDH3913415.1 crossover junction endodeoxyribonuclease RuvC [Rhodospirillales bacterium]MDH3918310.1 crossover junction endodeoxyribonuclease RuvC [Rhodospirillales bacterium]MDH3968778.1 crossover junction endodeoxyribonuclease RuvC [Rhodospirillales bacterium]